MPVLTNQTEGPASALATERRLGRDLNKWIAVESSEARERAALGQQLNLWTTEQAVHMRFADAFAMSMPLALAAATFMAHGITAKSALCTWIGGASVVATVAVQWRARTSARQELHAAAKRLGLSDSYARKWATDLLRSWLG
jgi:hypothetical protein